jgi:hypothetical protein
MWIVRIALGRPYTFIVAAIVLKTRDLQASGVGLGRWLV